MGPKSSNKCLYERSDKDPHSKEVPVKTEEEVGVMWPKAKESLEPVETGRGRKPSLLEILEGACPAPSLVLESETLVLDFWFPEL